jgi:hypothetical protein
MKEFLLSAAICLAVVSISAQENQSDRESQPAMKQLEFMVGEWKGTGWMMGRDGNRHHFDQTEKVEYKLDNTVILVEGLGKTDGVVTHNALAIISYNKAVQNYSFHSYLSSGLENTFTGEMKEGAFTWYMNENMRYVLRINEDGQWDEKGEMNRGGQWFQFMEMKLDRVD